MENFHRAYIRYKEYSGFLIKLEYLSSGLGYKLELESDGVIIKKPLGVKIEDIIFQSEDDLDLDLPF